MIDADFLCIEDLYTADECAKLCAAFHELRDKRFCSAAIDPYWNNRFVWLADILRHSPEIGRIMIEKTAVGRQRLAQFYKLKAPIYSDLLQIVEWPVGMSMPPHADNANPDGKPHGMPHRYFGGIAYLNDDYEGGELYFTALDLVIKPRRGMFLAFTGGFHHEHAVLRVTAGATRLTIPTFFTFDSSQADRLLHPGVAPERSEAAT